MPRKSAWVVGLALSLVVADSARAEFITFEGIAPPGDRVYNYPHTTRVIDGFNVRLIGGLYSDKNWPPLSDNSVPRNGMAYAVFFAAHGMRISLPSGGPFAIHSFDAADQSWYTPGGQKIYAFGVLADGVTVLKTAFTTAERPVGVRPSFQTFTFGPGWDKVVDVWITAPPIVQKPSSDYLGFAIDKIEVTPAPEPCGLALLGSGAAAALGYAWRRRRAAR